MTRNRKNETAAAINAAIQAVGGFIKEARAAEGRLAVEKAALSRQCLMALCQTLAGRRITVEQFKSEFRPKLITTAVEAGMAEKSAASLMSGPVRTAWLLASAGLLTAQPAGNDATIAVTIGSKRVEVNSLDALKAVKAEIGEDGAVTGASLKSGASIGQNGRLIYEPFRNARAGNSGASNVRLDKAAKTAHAIRHDLMAKAEKTPEVLRGASEALVMANMRRAGIGGFSDADAAFAAAIADVASWQGERRAAFLTWYREATAPAPETPKPTRRRARKTA